MSTSFSVACSVGPAGRQQQVRTFKTFSADLEALADWLTEQAVSQAVMEATGQYWKPCWQVLEERRFQLLLVNARHAKPAHRRGFTQRADRREQGHRRPCRR